MHSQWRLHKTALSGTLLRTTESLFTRFCPCHGLLSPCPTYRIAITAAGLVLEKRGVMQDNAGFISDGGI